MGMKNKLAIVAVGCIAIVGGGVFADNCFVASKKSTKQPSKSQMQEEICTSRIDMLSQTTKAVKLIGQIQERGMDGGVRMTDGTLFENKTKAQLSADCARTQEQVIIMHEVNELLRKLDDSLAGEAERMDAKKVT
jgi:hypothetical protein